MEIVDARFRVRHPCPYCEVSVRYPETLLLLWCDNLRDTFLVSSPDELELRRVLSDIRTTFRGRVLVRAGAIALTTVPEFQWASPPSVTNMARRSGLWFLPPVHYYKGWETYRLISPGRRRLQRFFSQLRQVGDIEVLSVADLPGLESLVELPVASVHLFDGLTTKQVEVMLAAIKGGLLEVPSRARWEEVARGLGLSRSTFGEHLRKGQRRLIENSSAALHAYLTTRGKPVLLPANPKSGENPRPLPRAGRNQSKPFPSGPSHALRRHRRVRRARS